MGEIVADKLKEEILDKSSVIFAHFGYKKTTMNDIARQIGKAKGAIYYYFKSKEEIFENVIKKEAEKLYYSTFYNIDSKKDIASKLTCYIENRSNYLFELSKRYAFLKPELIDFLPLIEKIRLEYHLKEISTIENIINEGVKKESINVADSHIAALTLVNALKGLEIAMFVRNDFWKDNIDLKELISLLLYGIIKK